MTISQTMTPFPTPIPSRDDPSTFAARADATLGHLEVFVPQANTMIGQINDETVIMAGISSTTQGYAGNAAQSAATATTAKNEAMIAAATAGYKGDWSNLTTYLIGETVTYLSRLFISKVNSNLNNTPTEGVNWGLLGTGRIYVGRYF